ncbi:hypothetical protein CDAR_74911 [Caerostris darwini]|uniref:Uncharacterized protein n=1 Tax=Caerostris darwini TaxID=1538125 RepID=A0AAV4P0I7_9ARAC|nr:hypothetical protein CDAR_74911 [Caerostris darwini]
MLQFSQVINSNSFAAVIPEACVADYWEQIDCVNRGSGLQTKCPLAVCNLFWVMLGDCDREGLFNPGHTGRKRQRWVIKCRFGRGRHLGKR